MAVGLVAGAGAVVRSVGEMSWGLDRRPEDDRPLERTVAIVGVGLIGGSVGLALRARGLADRVVGIGRNPERLERAQRLGAIDEATTDPVFGVAGASVAVICTPVDRIARDAIQAAADGPDDLLVTDAGSTKGAIVAAVEDDPRGRFVFVGAHPIAGSERQGAAHARSDLFDGRACVLTPTARTPEDRLHRARLFWEALGCRVTTMGPAEHDHALARTSHLPHAVAAALAATIPIELLGLAAGAYRDGTRVAAAEAALWAGIFLENRLPVLDALASFRDQLTRFEAALTSADRDALRRFWEAARARRLAFDGPPGDAS